MAMAGSCWSDVLPDILWSIINRLPIGDYIRCGAVCISWHTVLSDKRRLPAQGPWLMIPRPNASESFSLSENRTYNIDHPTMVGSVHKYIGSSNGWLVSIIHGSDVRMPELHMFDPLSGIFLSLPSISTLPFFRGVTRDSKGRIQSYQVSFEPGSLSSTTLKVMPHWIPEKVVVSMPCAISTSSSQGNFMVATIWYNNIACARVGDLSWTSAETPKSYRDFCDAIFCREDLYVVTRDREVLACHLSTNVLDPPRVTLVLPPPDYPPNLMHNQNHNYLVESCDGNLLQVWRQIEWCEEDGEYRTLMVWVYKRMDPASENNEERNRYWAPLNTLGDQALFLGYNHSFAVSIKDFPELKRNCIYFGNNNYRSVYRGIVNFGFGVYNFDDQTFSSYYLGERPATGPSVWFTPI